MDRKKRPDRYEKPVSLHPLGFEDALRGLMQVKPEKEQSMPEKETIEQAIARWKKVVAAAQEEYLAAEIEVIHGNKAAGKRASALLGKFLKLLQGSDFDWPEGYKPVGP